MRNAVVSMVLIRSVDGRDIAFRFVRAILAEVQRLSDHCLHDDTLCVDRGAAAIARGDYAGAIDRFNEAFQNAWFDDRNPVDPSDDQDPDDEARGRDGNNRGRNK
jgi:hypothetical protein